MPADTTVCDLFQDKMRFRLRSAMQGHIDEISSIRPGAIDACSETTPSIGTRAWKLNLARRRRLDAGGSTQGARRGGLDAAGSTRGAQRGGSIIADAPKAPACSRPSRSPTARRARDPSRFSGADGRYASRACAWSRPSCSPIPPAAARRASPPSRRRDRGT